MSEAFTFFASYRTATAKLDDATRLAVYDAVMDYALFGTEPVFDNVVAEAIFSLIRPNVDASNKKREAGSKGGANSKQTASTTEADGKQTASKPEANSKQTASDKDKDKDKDKDYDKDIHTPSIPLRGEGGKGERKSKAISSPEQSPEFMRFWSAYPRKDNRESAFTAWQSLNPSKELANQIVAHVLQRKVLWEWTKAKGQYIPYASAFLSNRRWEDDLAGKPKNDPRNAYVPDYAQHEDSTYSYDDFCLDLDSDLDEMAV